MFAIADGIGGRPGGGTASRLAIDEVKNWANNKQDNDLSALFHHVHSALESEAQRNSNLARLGTTLTVCLVDGSTAYLGHVGDCRLYQLRGNGIATKTEDQTEAQHLLNTGVINKFQAAKYARSHVLVSVLSATDPYDLFLGRFDLTAGDRLLLCSDGLYKAIPKARIRDLSVDCSTIRDLVDQTLHIAKALNPKDDYSLVAFEFAGVE